MIITGQPILERTKRAYTVYLAKLEAEQDGLFAFSGDPTGRLENIKTEIEQAENMIDAIHFELRKVQMQET